MITEAAACAAVYDAEVRIQRLEWALREIIKLTDNTRGTPYATLKTIAETAKLTLGGARHG